MLWKGTQLLSAPLSQGILEPFILLLRKGILKGREIKCTQEGKRPRIKALIREPREKHNIHFTCLLGTHQVRTNSRPTAFLTNVNSSYLHLNDSLESLRLGWLRLKLASPVQFLGRNTIEISLTVHPPVTPWPLHRCHTAPRAQVCCAQT